jgi:hypothetical protein
MPCDRVADVRFSGLAEIWRELTRKKERTLISDTCCGGNRDEISNYVSKPITICAAAMLQTLWTTNIQATMALRHSSMLSLMLG